MRTEIHTATTVDTDINGSAMVLKNGINGTGTDAVTTVDAEFFLHNNAPPFRYEKAPVGQAVAQGGRITGQAVAGLKTGCEPSRGFNANPGSVPGYLLVNQSCTGKRTGVTTNAAIYSWGSEFFMFFITSAAPHFRQSWLCRRAYSRLKPRRMNLEHC